MSILDWTCGTAGIAFQRCDGCGHTWYFHRDFCPACGAREPRSEQASARGTVHAITAMKMSVATTCTRTAVSVSRRQRNIRVIGTPQMTRSTIANLSRATTLFR